MIFPVFPNGVPRRFNAAWADGEFASKAAEIRREIPWKVTFCEPGRPYLSGAAGN